MQASCSYEVGWCHYLKNDFEKAILRFEPFVEAHQAKTYKAWCLWQLGNSYSLLGNDEKAMAAWAQVARFKRQHYSWDEYAARKSAQFIKAGTIPNGEAMLHCAYNSVRCRALVNAEATLQRFKEEELKEANGDLRAYWHYV